MLQVLLLAEFLLFRQLLQNVYPSNIA